MTVRKMKKHVKIVSLFLVVLTVIIAPFIFSKYATTLNDKLIIHVRQPKYTVVFNKNDELATGTMENQEFIYGTPQNLIANTFTKENYIFSEWNTESDGSGTSYSDVESVDKLTKIDGATVNLYAIWVEEEKVIVNFDANGGNNTIV